jgi:poly-gamma-glutamate synthesis protein (capsule biosynthesis protein)
MVIEAKETRKKRSVFKKILNYFLIVLFGILLYFLVTDKSYFVTGIKQILGIGRNHVVYETYTISFDESIKDDLKEEIKGVLGDISYNDIKRFEFVEKEGNILIKYDSEKKEKDLVLANSYLVPVGHVYWIEDSFVSKEGETVYVRSQSEADFISSETEFSPVVVENLLDTLEESEDTAGFIPIEELSFDYKLLYMDDGYFLDDFESGVSRMLLAEIDEEDDFSILKIVKSILNDYEILPDGYTEESIAKVNMTGVTAIARDLAYKIEADGNYAYPSVNIAEFLADADITHTSNEVSFVEGCIPNTSMSFCASPKYIASLEAIGVDIIELTGNHNNDYGADENTSTIETYIEKGWKYFGGGLDDDDASKILYMEVDGTTLAFIGYNYYDSMLGTGAIASDTHAGANYYSEEKMLGDITEAKENADIVIVDFQFQECYCYPDTDRIYPICYKPLSSPDQEYTFRLAIDDGADIVIGTQAHQPQTYELYKDGIIFYGLGNLFFDQDIWIGTRQGMILTHYFINGVHVQTKITATMYDSDLQVRVATEDEADQLFELLKEARE